MIGATVLVVCGDAVRRQSVVRALTQAGWRTVLSASGMSETARLIRGVADACVLVDAELEDMSGLKAAQILRDLCPHLKIIFTAARNSRELEEKVRSLEVFYYYISSADRSELVAAVREAIGLPMPSLGGRRPRVLVVDDDRDFSSAVRACLSSAGYDVTSAYSQAEGLDVARRERPDAILLDIIMSSTTDGFEFCREARRDPKTKHTPIIGVSAIEERTGLGRPMRHDPALFRQIIAFARSRYDQDKATYHVSATLASAPAPEQVSDTATLEALYLENWSDVPPGKGFTAPGRQILHCTFGSVLTDATLKGQLIGLLQHHRSTYDELLAEHFTRHLKALTAGM